MVPVTSCSRANHCGLQLEFWLCPENSLMLQLHHYVEFPKTHESPQLIAVTALDVSSIN